ncbi:hypothetical protein HK107_06300 [Parvularcula sp. ZS-1/3]|uniref:Sulphotransferase Stf0 domain-containing protein n=1 Tax=Parvularcula mediterranea TaxID=2732508 RepID=A0A7Y3RKV6_9PROT|nr:hypothetical protein [Parvularcula mediterranea]NNU15933.1 hypothetical protein [Parvularcula mediterranea]
MKRHAILTNGRSGSNFFAQVLNQHPHVVNYGEVLGPWTLPGKHIKPRFSGVGPYLDWMLSSRAAFYAGQGASFAARLKAGKDRHFRRRSEVRSIGFKEFEMNFRRMEGVGYFKARPDIALLILIRENIIDRHVSTRLLEATGVVADKDKAATKAQTVRLDPERIIWELDVIANENAELLETRDSHQGDTMTITYEGFFAGSPDEQAAKLKQIQEFIGVEPHDLASEHRKLRRTSLRETIENFGEISEVLTASHHGEAWNAAISAEGAKNP